ncbi:MAG: hypothetical protein ABIM59_04555 [candidate division WOR-3 bacterium]
MYNDWLPIRVEAEQPESVGSTVLRLSKRPVVDYDFDDSVLDDVEVYVDGAAASVASVDAERGLVALSEPVSTNSQVAVNYYWHPISDAEIRLAIAKASAEVELVAGRRFARYRTVERLILTEGSRVRLRDRVVSVDWVRVYDAAGELVDDSAEYVVEDAEQGVLRLKRYSARDIAGPFFLPNILEVEVSYTAGYPETPEHIKQYTILAATYEVLLRFQRMLRVERSYDEVALVVKSTEGLGERLAYLREEIERFRKLLPKPVRRV